MLFRGGYGRKEKTFFLSVGIIMQNRNVINYKMFFFPGSGSPKSVTNFLVAKLT